MRSPQLAPVSSPSTPPPKHRLRELRRLLPLLAPYRRTFTIAAMFLAVGTALGLVLPAVVRVFVDRVLIAGETDTVGLLVAGLIAVFIVQALAGATHTFLLSRVGERIVADQRTRLYAHLQSLPVSFFSEQRTGDLLSRLSGDIGIIQQALTGNVLQIVAQLFTVIGGVALMLTISWRLTLVAVAVFSLVFIPARLFGGRIRKATTAQLAAAGEANAVAEEGLTNIRVVRAFAREAFEVARYRAGAEGAYAAGVRRAWLSAQFGPTVGMIGYLGLLAILGVGSREVVDGRLTAGSLISYLFYALLVIGPIGALTNGYSVIQQALGAGERIFALLDEPPRHEGEELPDLPPVAGAVSLEHVWFDYGNGPVLFDVSLAAAPGEVIALVGPSGAGKTTIANLLLRFADPTAGAVRVDEVDVRTANPQSLRAQCAYVTQEVALFSGTVRENIRYGRLDATDAEIEEAARAANAHDFITALPNGYDAPIGERGVKLSGGQRQRLAIARALLRDPRILILDEATSALDTRAERAVQGALDRLMVGRTTMVIAHRLSTVERADRIYVLDGGRVIEHGTHAALLVAGGLYADLYHQNATLADAVIDGA